MPSFGITIFPTDTAIGPVEMGRLCEERGFESLFFPEHTHIPASRETPYPAGGDLPHEYAETHDPFIALAAVAGATERIRLGTGICLVVERDPIITAKEVASLDVISGGRFIFGVGAGWNLEEMRNHGTEPATRFRLLGERIAAIRAIWAEDPAAYHGEFVDFDPILCRPKPLQKPHPPILVGGWGEGALDRAVAWADEWMPIWVGDEGAVVRRIGQLREKAEAAGRGGELGVTLYNSPPDQAVIERLAEAGVGRFVFMLPPATRDVIEPKLDRRAELAGALAA